MDSKKISDSIIKELAGKNIPIYLTSYEGQGMFEADVFAVNRNGYMIEYEIKVSRSDFIADFKKIDKHHRLKTRDSFRHYAVWKKGNRTDEMKFVVIIPNRFYYVCPEGMIKLNEVPEYAGLIYITDQGELKEQKNAKLLHRNKATKTVYERIATILSERLIFGCSYATHKFREQKKKHDKDKSDLPI